MPPKTENQMIAWKKCQEARQANLREKNEKKIQDILNKKIEKLQKKFKVQTEINVICGHELDDDVKVVDEYYNKKDPISDNIVKSNNEKLQKSTTTRIEALRDTIKKTENRNTFSSSDDDSSCDEEPCKIEYVRVKKLKKIKCKIIKPKNELDYNNEPIEEPPPPNKPINYYDPSYGLFHNTQGIKFY